MPCVIHGKPVGIWREKFALKESIKLVLATAANKFVK